MAKIMLVEDDVNLREIYAARLQAENYNVVTASDGEEALAVAVKEKPDLIVLDVMMPKISGFDVLDILRSTPETRHAKIIMMTALSQQSDRERGERLGAEKYLVKSQVTLEDVVNTVSELLGQDEQAASAVIASNVQPNTPTEDGSLAGSAVTLDTDNTKEDSMDPQDNQQDNQPAPADDGAAAVPVPDPAPADAPAVDDAPASADDASAATLDAPADVAVPTPEEPAVGQTGGQAQAGSVPDTDDTAAETVEQTESKDVNPAPTESPESDGSPAEQIPDALKTVEENTTANDEPATEPSQVPMPSEAPADPPAPADDPNQVADPNNPEPGKVVMPDNNDPHDAL